MNKIRVIGILSSIVAIILFSIGGVSDIDSIGIAINCMLLGINVATWRV